MTAKSLDTKLPSSHIQQSPDNLILNYVGAIKDHARPGDPFVNSAVCSSDNRQLERVVS